MFAGGEHELQPVTGVCFLHWKDIQYLRITFSLWLIDKIGNAMAFSNGEVTDFSPFHFSVYRSVHKASSTFFIFLAARDPFLLERSDSSYHKSRTFFGQSFSSFENLNILLLL